MWTVLNEEYDIKCTFLDVSDELLNKLGDDIKKTGDKTYRVSNLKAEMTNWKTELKSFFQLESHIVNQYTKRCTFLDHWGAIYRDDDHALPHNHDLYGAHAGPNFLSFVFYVDAPEGSGKIYFSEVDLTVEPQNKMLVTFPTTVVHEVYPNTISGIERIITAGNIVFSVDNV